MDTIQELRLTPFTNSLYAQFINDVNSTIQEYTPAALRITKCYEKFTSALDAFDDVYNMQRKNNLTVELTELDKQRGEAYLCLYSHIDADLHNLDVEKRKQARYIINRMDSYGNPLRKGRRDESATLNDMGKALKEAPLSEYITALGQMDNLDAMIEANDNYVALSMSRTKSNKGRTLNATRNARLALDAAYRDIVSAVNSQVLYKSLVDETTSSEPEGPAINSVLNAEDPLEEFIQTINQLIAEYKTTAAQSGSSNKPGEEENEEEETPETSGGEGTDTPETPGGEITEEPDDRPTV